MRIAKTIKGSHSLGWTLFPSSSSVHSLVTFLVASDRIIMSQSAPQRVEYLVSWSHAVQAALHAPAQVPTPAVANIAPSHASDFHYVSNPNRFSMFGAQPAVDQPVEPPRLATPSILDVQFEESSHHCVEDDLDEVMWSDRGHDDDAGSMTSDAPMSICAPTEDGELHRAWDGSLPESNGEDGWSGG